MLRPLLDFTLAVVLINCLFTGGEDVRLVNSFDDCFGTVEVLFNGTWGTVCDDSWDTERAGLLCRQLGCGSAIGALGHALFGEGSGHVWLLDCSGIESSITQCSYKNNGNDCNHSKDAGVVCSASSVVIIVAVVTAVLLILSTLLVIFLVKRRQKQKKFRIRSCSKVSQDAVNMQDVLHRDHREEDADDDYEIVDMDDGDHEDGNSDSEQDYVNVGQDDTEQDYVNLETEDSAQDYVNVIITEHRIMLDTSYEDS